MVDNAGKNTETLLRALHAATTDDDELRTRHFDPAGGAIDPRGVLDTAGAAVDPREETSSAAGATGATLHDGTSASDVTESLTVPGRPDEVRIVVQNADGAYSVDVSFDNTTVVVQDAAVGDVDASRKVASNTTVVVTISDDSTAANTVDYDILLI